jgi:F-type H+-transporting ATPase subunit b
MLSALLASGDAPSLLDTLGVSIPVVVLQIVIFVTTFLVLSNGMFTRVLRRMQEREEEVRTAQAAVDHDRAELAKVGQEYQDQIAKIDRSAYEQAQGRVREAMASAATTVAQAQEQAKKEVDIALAGVAAEKSQARAALREDVTRLTLEVVEKVLETKLDPAVHGGVVRKFVSERAST